MDLALIECIYLLSHSNKIKYKCQCQGVAVRKLRDKDLFKSLNIKTGNMNKIKIYLIFTLTIEY